MFYAATNSYSTKTSIGFCNTWGVIGFATRAMRDAYVRRATDLATRAIKASEIKTYDGRPGQVSFCDESGAEFEVQKNGYEIVKRRTGRTIDPISAKLLTDGIWTHG